MTTTPPPSRPRAGRRRSARRAVISERVPAALDGERLDRIVSLLADVSRSAATAAIAAGGVTVDGAPATSGKVRLDEGALVEVDPAAIPRAVAARRPIRRSSSGSSTSTPTWSSSTSRPGSSSTPGPATPTARSSTACSPGSRTSPASASRCGPASSTASTPAARGCSSSPAPTTRVAALIAQFAAHSAGRRYDAVVWGHPEAPHGIVDAPIGRDPGDPLKMAVVVDGKPARTEYQRLERYVAPGRAGPAVVRAGDRADAPDPRPPRGDRPPARRRPDLRRPPHDARVDAAVPARRRAVVRPPGDGGAADVHEPAAGRPVVVPGHARADCPTPCSARPPSGRCRPRSARRRRATATSRRPSPCGPPRRACSSRGAGA